MHHTLDLGQLVHQVDLGVQSTSGIDDDQIRFRIYALLHGIEGHSRRIGIHSMGYHGYAHSVAPEYELIHCCSTEGISCTENDRFASVFK